MFSKKLQRKDTTFTSLDQLGRRICIIGPSSGGKSTLAKSIGEHLNLHVCHLDNLAHIPNTNWQIRDKLELKDEHDNFLTTHKEWVMEGNYSFLMPRRFSQASYIIWLEFNPIGAAFRYIIRSLCQKTERPGNLEGANRQLSWRQLYNILFKAPKLRKIYSEIIANSGCKLLRIYTFKDLKLYYKMWGLANNFK